MWVWSTCPWWNRDMQITEFVKQWIPAQLHSEADASKDGQIRPHVRPHIWRPWPDMKIWPGPGPDMISGATLISNHIVWVSLIYLSAIIYPHSATVKMQCMRSGSTSHKDYQFFMVIVSLDIIIVITVVISMLACIPVHLSVCPCVCLSV